MQKRTRHRQPTNWYHRCPTRQLTLSSVTLLRIPDKRCASSAACDDRRRSTLTGVHCRPSVRDAVLCALQASAGGAAINASLQPALEQLDEPALPPPPSPADKARATALCSMLVDGTEGLVLEALEVCKLDNCRLPYTSVTASAVPLPGAHGCLIIASVVSVPTMLI